LTTRRPSASSWPPPLARPTSRTSPAGWVSPPTDITDLEVADMVITGTEDESE
jgi:hypothetical protein